MNDNLYPDNNDINGEQAGYQQAAFSQMQTMQQPQPEAPVQKEKKKAGFGAGLGVGLGIGALALVIMLIVVITANGGFGKKTDLLDDETIEKVEQIKEIIDNNFYDYNDEQVTEEEMRDGICEGLVDSLNDKYATYYNLEDLQEMIEDNQGVYYGIGAYISLGDNGYPFFQSIIAGTPAEEVGLRAGDILFEVDGESTYGLTLDETVARVKGDEGTQVHLTIAREGEGDYIEVDVTRRRVESPTVSHEMLEDDIGYIYISEFDSVTVNQFAEAYNDIKDQGAKGLILDLRSNPGGLLDAVTEIARMILPEGVIVYEIDKQGARKDYICDGENEIDIPLVVLVNEYSASASEILSGSIRDHGVGTLVGENTYGKGIVQSIKQLSDGTCIKLTTSAYYLPNGECIQGVGIAPDVESEFDADKYYNEGIDTQLNDAIEVIKEKME